MGYRIAFIGTGPEPDNPVWGESAAMAYRHAPGYRDDDRCEIVSCADLVRENAEAFAQEFDIDTNLIFEDYNEMLRKIEPDIVSVCTPVPTHAPIVLDCIRSGILKAIHCEKPMATTWEDARRMAQEAAKNSIQLTFNHQRRFVSDWREPKERIENGEIGELQRLEVSCGELLTTVPITLTLRTSTTTSARPSGCLVDSITGQNTSSMVLTTKTTGWLCGPTKTVSMD